MLDSNQGKSLDFPMKVTPEDKFVLGNELVAATIKLETFFYDEFPELYEAYEKRNEGYKLTLGSEPFKYEVKKILTGPAYNVFNWFVMNRNAYIHHGGCRSAKNDKMRSELKAGDFTNGEILIEVFYSYNKSNEKVGDDIIQHVCKEHLSPVVFDKLFPKRQRKHLTDKGIFPSLAPQSAAIQPKVPVGGSSPASEVTSALKVVNIQPPILIPALAACLGIKPFNIMANLIKLGVFPAPNQPLEPEIAAKICEIHGFTFERKQ
jgi:hypothetical protein